MIKRKINWRLWIGLILTGALVFIALFGSFIAPYDINFSEKVSYIHTAHVDQLTAPPFPPSLKHWFGTDKWGYDILTQLLYGAKYTIFTAMIVALLRVIIGGLFGLWFGLNTKKKTFTPSFNLIGSLPAFLIVYFIMLGINYSSVSPWLLTFIQSFIMIMIGIPSINQVVQKKAENMSQQLFVEASRTLGGSRVHILSQHLFRNLKGEFIILFVNEMILVLSLIGQLGIFNLFLGGTVKQIYPTIYLSKTHEWSGVIGQARSNIYGGQWILLFPLAVYIITIFAFYMLSRGLEEHQKLMQRKTLFI